MKLTIRFAAACAVAAVSLVATEGARAQSASDLLQEYVDVYQDRLSGIDDLLVSQSVMGFTTQTYYEKAEVNGVSVLQPRMNVTGGAANPIEANSSEQLLGDPSGYIVEFADRAELDGTETVDGTSTTVIRVDDLSSLELSAPGQGAGAQSFEARTMHMFLDTDAWVVRRLTVLADAATPDGPAEVNAQIDFGDFEDVAGMPYPRSMVASISGLESAVSQEELEQARSQLEQFRTQLDNMPEDQRRMLEEAMGAQMEQLMQTLESGSMTIEVRVDDIRVNEGPPQA